MWFVDTDNVVSVVGLRNVVTGSFILNATVTGMLYKLPALNPNSAAAVDKGDGKVGIPCTAHGLVQTDDIRIERTQNYNLVKAVDADTTNDEIVITATYVAEIFTGEEFIYVALVGTTESPITFSYEAASDGNYIGKIPYDSGLMQDVDYMLCLKEVSGSEQVLAKVVYTAGFQGM